MNGYEQDQEWDAFPPGALPAQHSAAQHGAAQHPAAQQWQQHPWHPGYQQWPVHGPGWSAPALPWPDGPERPGAATAAAVLGFVTAGLTLLFSLPNLLLVVTGTAEATTHVLLLGVVTAAGLIAGAVRLLGRRSPDVLFGSAVASVTVLVLAVLAGALTIDRSGGLQGTLVFAFLASPLPILTAVFSWRSVVRGWAADQPR